MTVHNIFFHYKTSYLYFKLKIYTQDWIRTSLRQEKLRCHHCVKQNNRWEISLAWSEQKDQTLSQDNIVAETEEFHGKQNWERCRKWGERNVTMEKRKECQLRKHLELMGRVKKGNLPSHDYAWSGKLNASELTIHHIHGHSNQQSSLPVKTETFQSEMNYSHRTKDLIYTN